MKQADIRDIFKKAPQECLYVSCYGIFWPLVSCFINFFISEDSYNTEEDPHDPEQVNEGDIQMELSLVVQPHYQSSNK